jgi:hypothetical protein
MNVIDLDKTMARWFHAPRHQANSTSCAQSSFTLIADRNAGFKIANGHEGQGARSSGVTLGLCGRPATEPLSSTSHNLDRRSTAFMQGWQSVVHYRGKFVAKGLTKRCRSPMMGRAIAGGES